MARYADMHCDTLMFSYSEGDSIIYDWDGMQSLKKMADSGQAMQFFAVFFPPQLSEEERAARPKRESRTLPAGWRGKAPTEFPWPGDEVYFETCAANLKHQVDLHSDIAAMAYTADDVRRNLAEGKVSAMLTIEDGRMIKNLEDLARLKAAGVTAIALTWNFSNSLGNPNSKDPEKMALPLTKLGREAIPEMERLGILADVSHLSDGGFYDLASRATKPFIASHSNCRALTDHPRNLTDEMIRILADHGGVMGLNFAPDFVRPSEGERKTRVTWLADHVMHMINIGGEDIAALGTDFDGIGGVLEIGEPGEMDLLFDELKRRGLTERQLDKFALGNVLRVLDTL